MTKVVTNDVFANNEDCSSEPTADASVFSLIFKRAPSMLFFGPRALTIYVLTIVLETLHPLSIDDCYPCVLARSLDDFCPYALVPSIDN